MGTGLNCVLSSCSTNHVLMPNETPSLHPLNVDLQLGFTSPGEIGFSSKEHVPRGQFWLHLTLQVTEEISTVQA